MDPDAALADLRDALARYRATGAADDALSGAEVAAETVADAAEALDGWLTGGGFLPAAWAQAAQ